MGRKQIQEDIKKYEKHIEKFIKKDFVDIVRRYGPKEYCGVERFDKFDLVKLYAGYCPSKGYLVTAHGMVYDKENAPKRIDSSIVATIHPFRGRSLEIDQQNFGGALLNQLLYHIELFGYNGWKFESGGVNDLIVNKKRLEGIPERVIERRNLRKLLEKLSERNELLRKAHAFSKFFN